MVDRLAPSLGRGYGYLQVFLRLFLTDKVGQTAWPKTAIERYILFAGLAGYYTCYFASPPVSFGRRNLTLRRGGFILLYLPFPRVSLRSLQEILLVRRINLQIRQ